MESKGKKDNDLFAKREGQHANMKVVMTEHSWEHTGRQTRPKYRKYNGLTESILLLVEF